MNERLHPSEELIRDAEWYRTTGNPAISADMMRPFVIQTPDFLWEMDDPQRERIMGAGRIHVVSEVSRAKNSIRATSVADHLAQARQTIVTLYRHPAVKETYVRRGVSDAEKYNTYLETTRDEASYYMVLAGLTGNTGFLHEALRRLDEAAAGSGAVVSRATAAFESARLRFRHSPGFDSFAREDRAFRQVAVLSESTGAWERAATIGSRFTIDALAHGRFGQVLDGLGVVARAVQNDISTISIFPRQLIAEATEPLRHWVWNKTASPGTDYSYLKLPSDIPWSDRV